MARANIILIETWAQDIVFIDVGSYIAPPGSQNEELWQSRYIFRVDRPAGEGEMYVWETYGRLADNHIGSEQHTMAEVIDDLMRLGL